MVYCVGLTGGIGCGKTTVARLFAELGVGVVDTDEIARELTGANGAAMDAIRAAFGREFITPDGALDRAVMRRLVFADAAARARLERILHPLIRTRAMTAVAKIDAPYALLVVPLLLETQGYRELVQRVLVVDCDERLQVARTMARSHLTEHEVRAIMANQLARAERLRGADDVIVNDGDLDSLRAQVGKLHCTYLELARAV